MKKKYSKPTIKRIELKPEEAVLAGCKQKKVPEAIKKTWFLIS